VLHPLRPAERAGAIVTGLREAVALGSYAGLRVIENSMLTVGPFEDWSQVRSPGRAKRRRSRHPQRIRYYYKPDPKVWRIGDTLVMHPVTAAALRSVLP
jgi:hypothetical protein